MVDRAGLRVDWPTAAVAAAVYGSYGLLTWFYEALPWWAVVVPAGFIICLHGSLQHEAVHGQPTSAKWLNSLVVFPSLWLWLPYHYYRETHLSHHRDDRLTSPLDDPESYYLSDEKWSALGSGHRALRRALNTLLGRLVIGPGYVILGTSMTLADALRERDLNHLRHWLLHIPSVALVLCWVTGVCRIPPGEYLLLFVYPGLALTLLRSFAEHQAARRVEHRTAVVETGAVMSFLYLYNNLHALHHQEPNLVWHERPRRYRVRREELLAANDGYRFRGYGEILGRHLLRSKEPVVHPLITTEKPDPTQRGTVSRS